MYRCGDTQLAKRGIFRGSGCEARFFIPYENTKMYESTEKKFVILYFCKNFVIL